LDLSAFVGTGETISVWIGLRRLRRSPAPHRPHQDRSDHQEDPDGDGTARRAAAGPPRPRAPSSA